MIQVRNFDSAMDTGELRDCVIELQEFERRLDPRMPTGEEIADDYIHEMLKRCVDCDGAVLVADASGKLAGYVTILSRVQSDDLDDGNIEFGLVADLLVREAYRGSGLGHTLLSAAEKFAIANGVQWLRISVMAANHGACSLYKSLGYEEIYVELEKRLI